MEITDTRDAGKNVDTKDEMSLSFCRYARLRNLPRACIFLLLVYGFCFFGQCCAAAGEAGAASSGRYGGRVVSIIDGDSLVVRHGERMSQIRLWGIDAPEWDQPHAHYAKKLLQNMLLNRKVVIEPYYRDDYNRVIAQVLLGGQSINQLLVARGYAWVHIYYCKKEICDAWKRLQAEARKRGEGLWRNREAVPPWRWKRMKRR